MKAMLVDENKNLVWSEVADPVFKDDEVLVKIRAASLNRADLLQKQGNIYLLQDVQNGRN